MEYRNNFFIMVGLPLFLVMLTAIINFIIDPYNVNSLCELKFEKEIVSYRANYRLYKMQAYKNAPCANIYLGDSRMDGLSLKAVEQVSGEKWFNFAYAGGTAYEVVDSFWYAVGKQALKKVVIGINFNLYNGNNHYNLTQEAISTIDNPVRYYVSYNTLRVSLANILYKYLGNNLYDETPNMDKEAFWQLQLGKNTEYFYCRYHHPDDLQFEFSKISNYCHENNIELVFVFPPTHSDLQHKVADFGLTEEYNRYKTEIKDLGWPVYDFDIVSDFTMDRNLYYDPYHAGDEVKNTVINTVWGRR